MKATWNGVTVAESDETVVVEGFQKIQPGLAVNPLPWPGVRTAAKP